MTAVAEEDEMAVEERIAKLESDVGHLRSDLGEVKPSRAHREHRKTGSFSDSCHADTHHETRYLRFGNCLVTILVTIWLR